MHIYGTQRTAKGWIYATDRLNDGVLHRLAPIYVQSGSKLTDTESLPALKLSKPEPVYYGYTTLSDCK